MDVYEAIEKRRTIRVFKQGASSEQLRKIILAGTKASSGSNSQPWEFIIIDDQKIIDQIAELKYQNNRRRLLGGLAKLYANVAEPDMSTIEEMALIQKKAYQNASIIAVVCNQPGLGPIASMWLCIANIWLAAVTEGLGCLPSTFPPSPSPGKGRAKVEKILGLPKGHKLITVLVVGVPGEEGYPRDKNPWASKRQEFSWLHKNKFGEN
ncbi:nitroreductase family protein [Chloroflexota bacterium]